MANKLEAFAPLEFNPTTNEPYLHLLPPHENIMLTLLRDSDAPLWPPIMNDPRVYMNLLGPPFPYTEKDSQDWAKHVKKQDDLVLEELRECEKRLQAGNEEMKMISGCPVHFLREVLEDGTEVFVGDIEIHRCRFFHRGDEKELLIAENEAKPVGDPTIVWEFGYYLAPEYHRKGIMAVAMKTVLDKWAIPRMGARKFQVTAFKGNRASVRVCEKNGFVETDLAENCVGIVESKGGGKMGLHVMELQL